MIHLETTALIAAFVAVMAIYFAVRAKQHQDERENPFLQPSDLGPGHPWILHFAWRAVKVDSSRFPIRWGVYVWRRKQLFSHGKWIYQCQPARSRPLNDEEILDAADRQVL